MSDKGEIESDKSLIHSEHELSQRCVVFLLVIIHIEKVELACHSLSSPKIVSCYY